MTELYAKPIILDCTIRDGNYAVDFKFNVSDTTLIACQLASLGIEWIEVGHGLGLGAMSAGKGDMPASDEELIEAAKKSCGQSKVGAFFIPGVGKAEDLRNAVKAGLDFVRIGANADEVDTTHSYLSLARELGLAVAVNIMKSYAVTPKEFAKIAAEAEKAGAQIIYCVDSAGSMLPEDTREYVRQVRQAVECELGFHGHNNLMLGVSNCMAAFREGACYLDTSLCGLGRSAGNVPTEILLAVLERSGIPTGIDLFKLMDVIEVYIWPLVSRVRPHDMLGVTAGYSQFHSSYLPSVARAAKKYGSEIRRLIARVAQHDPVSLDLDFLRNTAEELAGSQSLTPSKDLVTFDTPEIKSSRISNSLQAVNSLLAGMLAVCAKLPGAKPFLLLKEAETQSTGLKIPEFLLQDNQLVLGRVTYGSEEDLSEIVEATHKDIFRFLVNEGKGWAKGMIDRVSSIASPICTIPVNDERLRADFLASALERASVVHGREGLLIFGTEVLPRETLIRLTSFSPLTFFGKAPDILLEDREYTVLTSWAEWRHLGLKFNMALCAADPSEKDAKHLSLAVTHNGIVISLLPRPNSTLYNVAGLSLMNLNMDMAYVGFMSSSMVVDSIIWNNN